MTDIDLRAIRCKNELWREVDLYVGESCAPNKITITFEVPEKKVTITESQFDEMFDLVFDRRAYAISHSSLKQKLFATKDGE